MWWKALVDERLEVLGTRVLSLVSDRAKALIQLAEKGLECLSMPDFFHCLHDLGKSYALALGQKLRQAQQALTHAETRLARDQDNHESALRMAACSAEVTRWSEVQRIYSAASGDPLAHPPSLQHRHRGSANIYASRPTAACGGGGH